MMGIYGIKNKINGKWYIGQSVNIEERWDSHTGKKEFFPEQCGISKEIQEVGEENYEFVLIEEVKNREDLDEREIYYIEKYDSYINGYNETRGGRTPWRGFRLKVTPEEIIDYYYSEMGITCRKTAEHFGIDKDTVVDLLKERGLEIKPIKGGTGKPLVLINNITGEETTFYNCKDAAIYIKEITDYDTKIDTIRKSLNKGKYKDFTVRFL